MMVQPVLVTDGAVANAAIKALRGSSLAGTAEFKGRKGQRSGLRVAFTPGHSYRSRYCLLSGVSCFSTALVCNPASQKPLNEPAAVSPPGSPSQGLQRWQESMISQPLA